MIRLFWTFFLFLIRRLPLLVHVVDTVHCPFFITLSQTQTTVGLSDTPILSPGCGDEVPSFGVVTIPPLQGSVFALYCIASGRPV